MAFDERGIDLAFDERGMIEDFAVNRNGGLDAFDHELAQRPAHGGERRAVQLVPGEYAKVEFYSSVFMTAPDRCAV